MGIDGWMDGQVRRGDRGTDRWGGTGRRRWMDKWRSRDKEMQGRETDRWPGRDRRWGWVDRQTGKSREGGWTDGQEGTRREGGTASEGQVGRQPGDRGTEGQQGTGTGQGIPWGRQRGQGEVTVGDVDGRDTPVGRDRGQGTGDRGQREVFKETPQHRARSSTVSPRTVSLSPAGSDQDHPHVPSPWSLPCRVPMSMSCSVCPLPVPVPHVCPCPHSPYLCPLHVPMPPCPSAGGCMAHAHSCVPKHMLSPSPALGSPCHCCSPESTEGGWDVQGQHP